MMPVLFLLTLIAAALAGQASGTLQADPAIACSACGEWNEPREPFPVFGNTYYVGVGGLSAVLIASDAGLVLLDGALPQSAPLIAENIRRLGFRLEDVRLIVNSHAHFDHAGGIAALQRASGAAVAASARGARALERGEPTPDDPQYAFGPRENAFPRVRGVRGVADGEVLRVGPIALTAHLTPGHTPGSTTWSWRSCEGSRCLDIVYADSLNAVSAPGFRFGGTGREPGRVAAFRTSIEKVASLPCDVLLTVHPGFADLDGKLARRQAGSADAFVDSGACRAYAADARTRLDKRVAEEAADARGE